MKCLSQSLHFRNIARWQKDELYLKKNSSTATHHVNTRTKWTTQYFNWKNYLSVQAAPRWWREDDNSSDSFLTNTSVKPWRLFATEWSPEKRRQKSCPCGKNQCNNLTFPNQLAQIVLTRSENSLVGLTKCCGIFLDKPDLKVIEALKLKKQAWKNGKSSLIK